MVFLSGNITAAEMQAYYRQALVPLGWTETGEMRYCGKAKRCGSTKTTAAGTQL